MAIERTLAIIKPDAVGRGLSGDIIKRIEGAGLRLRTMRLMRLGRAQAEAFYEVHKARSFYGSLCEYMSSGPVVVMALEADGAIAKWRDLMGATDPAKAAPGTIRKEFGMDVEKNATHGSDASETAAREVAFFFSSLDIVA
jgi:nucleoside-diphosphate kinase